MMTPGCYRPTTLKLAARHCPLALSFYAADRATDRRIFAPGTAAHACLRVAQQATNDKGREVARCLVGDRTEEEGREP